MQNYNSDDNVGMDGVSEDNIQWLSPWSYPTRVTDALATQIATAIAHGASLVAAGMAHGVAPTRLKEWLRWGNEAYMRDANPEDYQAQYLNLFLKVMQAVGIASVPAQQEVRHSQPNWWLAHNPETRGEWGDGNQEHAVLALPAPTEQPTAAAGLTDDPEELRKVWKVLVESGAAVPLVLESSDMSATDGLEQAQ